MDVILIRPSAREKNYQTLEPISAIEPPHWIACRQTELLDQSHTITIVDMQIGQEVPHCHYNRAEIWATGSHPSAWYQAKAAILPNLDASAVTTITKLPSDYTTVSPCWTNIPIHQYRAHNWHSWSSGTRSPYQTIHTSLSCPYNCKFCTIHEFYPTHYKVRPIPDVVGDFLPGIRNVKIMDELFITKSSRTFKLLSAITSTYSDYYNIWGYTRIDAITPAIAKAAKAAGVNWLCVGIESGVQSIRERNGKGSFTNTDVKTTVSTLKDAGISVLANFMFGFLNDTQATMQATLDLANTINAEYTNFYCVVPYPNSEVAKQAASAGLNTSRTPSQWAQYSYDFKPMGTLHLTPTEVLRFRDTAYSTRHNSPTYQRLIAAVYGPTATTEPTSTLKRRLFGDAEPTCND